ncbi:MAG: hypothetical protein R3C26_22915 [Calditrichia bacterium]
MRIDKIFIEQQVLQHPQTQRVIAAFPKSPIHEIVKVEDVFERARKPYLQKRDALNLFIGKKEGQLVKPAPEAYGVSGEPHYYFVHAYNCIYECEYCYLQGYFQSPDLVMFVNHDDIISEIRTAELIPPTKRSGFMPVNSAIRWRSATLPANGNSIGMLSQKCPMQSWNCARNL